MVERSVFEYAQQYQPPALLTDTTDRRHFGGKDDPRSQATVADFDRWWKLADYGWAGSNPTPPPPSRDDLIYGTYEPSLADDTVGVLQTTASHPAYNPVSSDGGTFPDGFTLTGQTLYGNWRPPSVQNSDIILIDCILPGALTAPSGAANANEGIINCDNTRSGTGKVILIDCSIICRTPGNSRDGVRGHKFEAYRCYVSGTTDGFGPFAKPGQNSGRMDVVIEGCLVEKLVYVYPDTVTTSHSDGTHNDCIQVQGGTNALILGNSLRGTAVALPGTGTNPSKPWLIGEGFNNGGCFTIQNNTGVAIDATVICTKNYMYGGLADLNGKTGITYEFSHNQIYRTTPTFSSPTPGKSWGGYWLRLQDHNSTVIGLDTNVWIDGPYAGNVLTEPRDLGIEYDA